MGRRKKNFFFFARGLRGAPPLGGRLVWHQGGPARTWRSRHSSSSGCGDSETGLASAHRNAANESKTKFPRANGSLDWLMQSYGSRLDQARCTICLGAELAEHVHQTMLPLSLVQCPFNGNGWGDLALFVGRVSGYNMFRDDPCLVPIGCGVPSFIVSSAPRP